MKRKRARRIACPDCGYRVATAAQLREHKRKGRAHCEQRARTLELEYAQAGFTCLDKFGSYGARTLISMLDAAGVQPRRIGKRDPWFPSWAVRVVTSCMSQADAVTYLRVGLEGDMEAVEAGIAVAKAAATERVQAYNSRDVWASPTGRISIYPAPEAHRLPRYWWRLK